MALEKRRKAAADTQVAEWFIERNLQTLPQLLQLIFQGLRRELTNLTLQGLLHTGAYTTPMSIAGVNKLLIQVFLLQGHIIKHQAIVQIFCS